MFRWLLRQLNVIPSQQEEVTQTIEYNCKNCNMVVKVLLTKQEWEELRTGIPFDSTFSKERKAELTYFRNQLCRRCENV